MPRARTPLRLSPKAGKLLNNVVTKAIRYGAFYDRRNPQLANDEYDELLKARWALEKHLAITGELARVYMMGRKRNQKTQRGEV